MPNMVSDNDFEGVLFLPALDQKVMVFGVSLVMGSGRNIFLDHVVWASCLG